MQAKGGILMFMIGENLPSLTYCIFRSSTVPLEFLQHDSILYCDLIQLIIIIIIIIIIISVSIVFKDHYHVKLFLLVQCVIQVHVKFSV
jgi:hypothetical protein